MQYNTKINFMIRINSSLNYYPIDDPEQRIEPIIGARGMAVVLNKATPAPPLHYPCINHFRQCLETNDNEVCMSIRIIDL